MSKSTDAFQFSTGRGGANGQIRTRSFIPRPPAARAPRASPSAGWTLSARAIELVQRSWAKILPASDSAATLFYDLLFELDPSLRPLFRDDLSDEKRQLMQTIGMAVDGLSVPARLIPVLEALGARHGGYMVAEHHYDLAGEALLWTLREGLGDDFNREVEAAWTEAYAFVSSIMKKAAADHAMGASGARPVADATKLAAPAAKPDVAAVPSRRAPRPDAAPPIGMGFWDRPSLEQPPLGGRTLTGLPTLAPVAAPTAWRLSGHTIELVQESWAKVQPVSDLVAGLFFERLFELDPLLRALFEGDLDESKRQLMDTLAVAVDGLGEPVPLLQTLRARQAESMLTDRHYDLGGEALVWALGEGLGYAFTKEVEAAWIDAYAVVSNVMKKAPAPIADPAPRAAGANGKASHVTPSGPRVVFDDDGKITLEAEAVDDAPLESQSSTFVVPVGGREVTLHVHVKMRPAPSAAELPAPSGLGLGAILVLLCVVSSVGSTVVLALSSRAEGALSALYGVPVLVMLLVFGAFRFGQYSSRGRAPAASR